MSEFPSKEHQFKEGNEFGKISSRKGIPNAKTVINARAEKEVTSCNGDKVTKFIKMIDAQIDKAVAGDTTAFKEIFDRMYGKSQQSVEQTNTEKRLILYPHVRNDRD